jgi:nitroreductase
MLKYTGGNCMEIDDFIKLTRTRRSIRRFKPDPFPDECIDKIIEAARFAQSGANAQPWEFIVVKNKEKRARIVDLVMESHKTLFDIEKTRLEELRHPAYRGGERQGQANVAFGEAPVLIVVCVDPRPVMATVIGAQYLPAEGAPYAHVLKNAANATQIMTLAAAACGLGSQWVSVISTIEARLKELLKVPVELAIHTIIPIGYPAYTPAPAYRREPEEITHHEEYDQAKYRSGDDIFAYLLSLRQKTRQSYPDHKAG